MINNNKKKRGAKKRGLKKDHENVLSHATVIRNRNGATSEAILVGETQVVQQDPRDSPDPDLAVRDMAVIMQGGLTSGRGSFQMNQIEDKEDGY